MSDDPAEAIKQSIQAECDRLRRQTVLSWSIAAARYAYYSIQEAVEGNTNACAWYGLVATECGKMARDPSRKLSSVLEQEMNRILSTSDGGSDE